MNLHGLFRCKVNGESDFFNFFIMKLARNSEQQLVWEFVDSFRHLDRNWRLDDIPLVRDLTKEEEGLREEESLLFYQSDLEAFQ